jgi:chromosomal replication initiator protein
MTLQSRLIPKFTFERFVAADSNRVALTAARQCAEQPGRVHNPLLICGATGLGKSHLVHAMAHLIASRDPGADVLVMNRHDFVYAMIAALRNDRIEAFRADLRRETAFCLEDIQFLTGKDRSQMELFQLFDALHADGRQLVFTCNEDPGDVRKLEARLSSRVASGLVAGIGPPEYETRLAILKKSDRLAALDVDEEILRLIARRITTSGQDLQGALATVLARSRYLEQPLTGEFTSNVLDELLGPAEELNGD